MMNHMVLYGRTKQAHTVLYGLHGAGEMNGKLFTLDQVAEYLGVHRDTVYNLVRSGKLPGLQLGGRKAGWRVTEEDLQAFINDARGTAANHNGNDSDAQALADLDRRQFDDLQAFKDRQAEERRDLVSRHRNHQP